MKRAILFCLMAGTLLLAAGCGGTADNKQNMAEETSGTSTVAGDSSSTADEILTAPESTSTGSASDSTAAASDSTAAVAENSSASVTEGTEEYRGFLMDNVLHSENDGDIHYLLYVPDSYDGSEPYAIFFTLPGYEGLYFQGVGENLYSENFAFTAQEYNPKMIVVAPQLSDWGETSADQTIALVEYFLANYNIDEDKVYAEGFSGGGETMSLVMEKRPELFTAYLQCSSQWDGDYEPVTESRTPVYLAVGESDEYYGQEPSREAYENLYDLYREQGLSDEEIGELLVLDVKDAEYFESRGMTNQHGGGGLFAEDEEIMGWLFGK